MTPPSIPRVLRHGRLPIYILCPSLVLYLIAGKPVGRELESKLNVESSTKAASVTVTAAARLHLGFLDLNGGLGRRFGSIGLAIDAPRTRLTISSAARNEIV